jgi:hypothetical protein
MLGCWQKCRCALVKLGPMPCQDVSSNGMLVKELLCLGPLEDCPFPRLLFFWDCHKGVEIVM